MVNNNIITHTNDWWWGFSVDIVRNDGFGVVCVKFDKDYPNAAYICDLSVYEYCRKQGYGTELMYHAFDIARRHDKSFVLLRVDKTKDWLVHWYKVLGFEILSEDEHEYEMIKKVL